MAKKKRGSSESVKHQRFIGELLMEFPEKTLKEVTEAWHRQGNKGALPKEDYDRTKEQVAWMIKNPGCRTGVLNTSEIMRADARRRKREEQKEETRRIQKQFARGAELTGANLIKMYDEHFEQVLSRHIRLVTKSKGKRGKYKVVKSLPGRAEYQSMARQTFTLPLGRVLSEVRESLQDQLDELSRKYDQLSDGAQEGKRGETLCEKIDALGDVVLVVSDERVPPVVTNSPYYRPPTSTAKRGKHSLQVDLQRLKGIVEYLGTQLLPSLDVLRAISPELLTKAQGGAVLKALGVAEAEILRFWQGLEDAVDNLDVALDS